MLVNMRMADVGKWLGESGDVCAGGESPSSSLGRRLPVGLVEKATAGDPQLNLVSQGIEK
jgi:hypothetical protein